jgi:hypothetical protein
MSIFGGISIMNLIFCCTHENLANYFKFSQKSNLKVTKGVLDVRIWLTFFRKKNTNLTFLFESLFS